MSPRPKKEEGTVVEVESNPISALTAEDGSPEASEPIEVEPPSSRPVTIREINEYIADLVKTLVQQEIAGLDERIRDLEVLKDVPHLPPTSYGVSQEVPEFIPADDDGVPEYTQSHQETGDGVPFYRA